VQKHGQKPKKSAKMGGPKRIDRDHNGMGKTAKIWQKECQGEKKKVKE